MDHFKIKTLSMEENEYDTKIDNQYVIDWCVTNTVLSAVKVDKER